MARLNWTPNLVCVTQNGVEMIVQSSCVTSIVAVTAPVLVKSVTAKMDGAAICATLNFVTQDATNMANVRTAPVFVSLVGTANTVLLKVVPEGEFWLIDLFERKRRMNDNVRFFSNCNSCSNHGQCRVNTEGQWECRCYDGWDGVRCDVQLEVNCGDNKDNDKGSVPHINQYLMWHWIKKLPMALKSLMWDHSRSTGGWFIFTASQFITRIEFF